jgi:hypothetical protein
MSEQNYNIKFASIELVSKSLIHPPILSPDQPLNYVFNFLVDIKLDVNRKIAIVVSDFGINEVTQNLILGSFKILCLFEFPEFEKVFKKVGDNLYDVPMDIEILLKSTAVATSRGIIFSELRGTYLHSAILPLIDVITPIRAEHEKRKTADVIYQ